MKLSRNFKFGTVATAITVAVTVILVVINVLAGVLLDRYPLAIDMTSDSIFQLTEDSIDYLQGMEQDVQIYVLTDQEDYTNSSNAYLVQANEVINQYQKYTGHIKLSYINLLKNPEFSNNYPDLSLSSNNILVVSGDRTKLISVNDLFNIESDSYYGSYITSSKAEQAMTSAIMSVLSENRIRMAIVSDVSSSDMASFQSLFETNNYEIETLSILTDEIDEEIDILVLAAPSRDLAEDEIAKLDAFLENNGNLGKTVFYIAHYQQPETPNIDGFLRDWGISIGPDVIYQTDTSTLYTYDSPFYFMSEYLESTYSAEAAAKGLRVATPYSRPVEALFETSGTRSTTSLLGVNEDAYLYPIDAGEDFTPTTDDDHGPFDTLVLGNRAASGGSTLNYSYVLASGSLESFGSSHLTSTRFSNSEYFVGIFNTLYNNEASVTIAPKTLGSASMDISAGTAHFYAAFFIAIVPIFVFALGLFIWLRRRRL